MYEVYTFPNCDKCLQVKEVLDDKGIEYKEINIGMPEGKKEFGKIYLKVINKLKKDEHGLIMPILVRMNGAGIEGLAQGVDEVLSLLERA